MRNLTTEREEYTMTQLDHTAVELLTDLAAGRATSVELTRTYLDQIERHDSRVRAFLRVDADAARRGPPISIAAAPPGAPVGRLGGLPVAIKDVLLHARRVDYLRIADAGKLSAAV